MIRSAKFILGGFLLYRGKTGGLIINNSYCYPLTNDLTPLTSVIIIGESGWRSGHQSRLPPLRPGIEAARGLRFVDLNLTPRVFLRVLRFSSLCKFDFHAKI